jgi:hypothetical protein
MHAAMTMAGRAPSPTTIGPASPAPRANEPIFSPAAVVNTWPWRSRGTVCWRTANVAARPGPSAMPAMATTASAAGSDCASGQLSISTPKIARAQSTIRSEGQRR